MKEHSAGRPGGRSSGDRRVFALITGGGTGGHVYPGLALAEALVTRGHSRESLHWVGNAGKLEETAVPAAGLTIDLLPGRGLQRRLTTENIAVVAKTAKAFGMARRIVRRTKPDVVVGVGGYASLPCLVAARLRRIPTVVHEQNAAPGLANRIAVRLGARAAVSLPGTPLPGAVVTGNPVRAAVVAVERRPSADRTLLAVFGGSLGARRINEAAAELYDLWRNRGDVVIHHVSGAAGHDAAASALAAVRRDGDVLDYRLLRYEENMPDLYAVTTVAVCRAGATTVAELAAAGVPSVLVPLPGAPGDHQTRNAEALVAAGAAVLVPDAECTGARLAAELQPLLADPARLQAMAEAARTLARPGAADDLAALVEAAAARKPFVKGAAR
ncbi:MAG TPA: undecaprenyldiphospho-muramoylpentapeptide beta-N-acetylglucosaminyltransferase [Acidimicrobiia bacterium]|nr:undecaprenyldiphospho-muramoylpentapeptide beta-N-acetylglucosaminyltransferase [Acidimicrobiia bacterium]